MLQNGNVIIIRIPWLYDVEPQPTRKKRPYAGELILKR